MKPLVHRTSIHDHGLVPVLLSPVALFILCVQFARLISAASRQDHKSASLQLHYIQVAHRMRDEGLSSEKAYALLAKLIAHSPNRLAGSEGATAEEESTTNEG